MPPFQRNEERLIAEARAALERRYLRMFIASGRRAVLNRGEFQALITDALAKAQGNG